MDEFPYGMLHWALLKEFRLTPTEGLFMVLIYGLSHQGGWCFASKTYLSEAMNLSETSIYALIKRLGERALIKKGPKSRLGTICLQTADEWGMRIEELKVGYGKEKMGYPD